MGHRIYGDRTTRVRGIGWKVFVAAVDNVTLVAYSDVRHDETGVTAAALLSHAVAWYAAKGLGPRV